MSSHGFVPLSTTEIKGDVPAAPSPHRVARLIRLGEVESQDEKSKKSPVSV